MSDLRPKGFGDRRAKPSEELIDERLSILCATLEAAGDPASGVLPAEIEANRDELPVNRAAGLLVIDDLDAWFGKPGNLLSAAALARIVQRLNELARSKGVAIVALVRSQLSVEGRITTRQLGRLANAASVVWMVVRSREQGRGDRGQGVESEKGKVESEKGTAESDSPRSARWLLPVKNNLAVDGETFGRAFDLVEGRIQWRPGPAPNLADAMLPSAQNNERRRLRRAAVEWLQEALAGGPLPSNEVYEQALKCGFSKGTMVRAVNEVGIRSHKTGFEGGWEMRWPPAPRQAESPRRWEGGLRIVGAGEQCEAERQRDGETERGSERETERQDERESASCDSSVGSCDSSVASCESSVESCDSSRASCDSSRANCDSSAAERQAECCLESAPAEEEANRSLVDVLDEERKAC